MSPSDVPHFHLFCSKREPAQLRARKSTETHMVDRAKYDV